MASISRPDFLTDSASARSAEFNDTPMLPARSRGVKRQLTSELPEQIIKRQTQRKPALPSADVTATVSRRIFDGLPSQTSPAKLPGSAPPASGSSSSAAAQEPSPLPNVSVRSASSASADEDDLAAAIAKQYLQMAPDGFCSLPSPSKARYYPVTGDCKVQFSPNGRRENVVYAYASPGKRSVYVGHTNNSVSRASSHGVKGRKAQRGGKASKFYRALADGKVTQFVILAQDVEDRDRLESAFITLLRSNEGKGLNTTKGGNGGRANSRAAESYTSPPRRKMTKKWLKMSSPEGIHWTPVRKATKDCIYGIARIDSKGHIVKIYVGKTGQTCAKRQSKTLSRARTGYQGELYDDLRDRKPEMRFMILEDGLDGVNLAEAEQSWIRWVKDQGYAVYNKNKGGNGSA